MKKMITLALLMTTAIAANAMSYTEAKHEALFLSDKMAYELNLNDAQYDAVYEINLDYLMSVNSRHDALGSNWNRRNADLRYVLTAMQYSRYIELAHFYRPLSWSGNGWNFTIYGHYTHRDKFYRHHPSNFDSYRGGGHRSYAHFHGDCRPEPPRAGHAPTWRHPAPDAPHHHRGRR